MTDTPPAVVFFTEDPPPDDGRALVPRRAFRTTGTLTPQQQPGTVRVVSAESPPAEQLTGLAAVAAAGFIVQPVVRPTASVVATSEDRRPEAGRAAAGKPPVEYLPTARAFTATAAIEEQPPASGALRVGLVGFGDPRRPVRTHLARPECMRPHPGEVLAGKPPPPDATPQEPAGVARTCAGQDAPPESGWCLARAKPLVPSDRLPFRALAARAEESAPEAGRTLARRVELEVPPPGRVVFVATENPPGFDGAVLCDGPLEAVVPAGQLPGRVLVTSNDPVGLEGRALTANCRLGGAIPPVIG